MCFRCYGNLNFHIHVLIMGKVEIGICFCVTADILTKVLLKYFWSNPPPTIRILSKSLILIGGFGNRKAKVSKKQQQQQQEKKKTFKNLLLRSHMGDEAETLHNFYDISLYMNCVFFIAIAH